MEKLKAITLTELVIGMIVLSIIIIASMGVFKPSNLKDEAMLKSATELYNQLLLVTTNVGIKYSSSLDLRKLYTQDKTSRFEITDDGATAKLLALYKSQMTIANNTSDLSYLDYSGNYTLKNGAFFAMKLYGNCSTTTTTYNPIKEVVESDEDLTCGAIFFDINDSDAPNILGKDRFIIAVDKHGLR